MENEYLPHVLGVQ